MADEPVAPGFAEFFVAAWGHQPFAWQKELAQRVSEAGWPSLLDVPTGMGKTAALDVFVWHLASQAHLDPSERTAPMRAAFVIDRRLVVDSAFERMRRLTRRLATVGSAPEERPLRAVADRLRSIGQTDFPLIVQRMRGGITWEAQWVRQPDQPAIVCGTVDQVGSRLLCRGYGSGPNRMPIDTGLLGQDCLLLVDEAHLSSALVTSVDGVRLLEPQAENGQPSMRSARVVRLTATPPERPDEGALRVDRSSIDAQDGTAVPRLTALKRAVVVPVKKPDDIVATMTNLARTFAAGTSNVVLVVCNTVLRARAVYEHAATDTSWDAFLLIGRCRTLERADGEPLWFPRAQAGRTRGLDARPLLLVATQTIEVGVDLDADAIVTEIAAADALAQRFGRVDRLGHVGDTLSAVVGCPAQLADDPIYGSSTEATWGLLTEATQTVEVSLASKFDAATVRTSLAEGPWFDAGPLAFRELIDASETRHTLFAPAAPAPVILRQTLDCWARTSPIPDPDEAVAPYLHGVDRGNPVVSVVWRAGNIVESVERYPLRGEEMVEVPLKAFRRFLAPSADAPKKRSQGSGADADSDLESRTGEPDDELRSTPTVDGIVVRSRSDVIHDLRQVRPGDVVVLDSNQGGHDDHGWTGALGGIVADVADLMERRHLRVRLDADVLESFGIRGAATTLQSFAEFDRDADMSESVHVFLDEIHALLEGLAKPTLAAIRLRGRVELLRAVEGWVLGSSAGAVATVVVEPISDDGLVTAIALVAPRPVDTDPMGDDASTIPDLDDENDDSSLLGPDARDLDRSLLRHSNDVSTRAGRFAHGCGLGAELVRTLRFAGFLHDLGKAETRFQAMLEGGDLARAEARTDVLELLLAKSDLAHDDRDAARAATRNAGWPNLRHEAISLALAKTWPASAVPAGVDLDLALHLVATHHGYGRPWFPADRSDDRPRQVEITLDTERHVPDGLRDSTESVRLAASSSDGLMAFDQPDRFARLRERYGFWGLCHLEAILRLADMTISEELGWNLDRNRGVRRG